MKRHTIAEAVVLCCILAGFLLWRLGTGKSPSGQPLQPTAAAKAEADPMSQALTDIVARYRKTIVLLEDDDSVSEPEREKDSLVGKIIFQENHQATSNLSDSLTGEIEKAGDFSQPLPGVSHFLDLIETQMDLHDADKLGFREVLADMAETLAGIKSAAPQKADLESRVDTDRKALVEIQSLYEKELDKIFGRFETRGIPVRREAWDRYVAYLRTQYKREDILREYEQAIAQIGSSKAGHQDNDLEIFGTQLPSRTILLTFDDGPHPRYTDRIQEILNKYQVKAVFFELGTNLGRIKQNRIQPTEASAAALRLKQAGFVIGSHGFSHQAMPKMSDVEIGTEIDETDRLLQTVVNVHPALFRPPYGEKNAKVLAAIEAHRMKSILWNIDSKDWADPIAKSIANRVIAEAHRSNHGIVLMHDIHERTIEALPLIIETLKSEGYRFLNWDGHAFSETGDLNAGIQPTKLASAPSIPPAALYRESWAVVVGIDNYARWPKLHYAVNDANGVKDILLTKFHFKPDHVFTLLNEDATRERILSVLGDTLSNPQSVQRDDRVFVFFAGHGATRRLPSGRDLGYIVPVEADTENFQGQSISMSNFQDISESIPAKHVLFVMDSCYSGLAVTRGQSTGNYIKEMSRRTARQMLTAGGADEEVADNGPNGHSVFTWTLLQGLEGRADLNSDGFISASELAAYVGPGVSALSHQTPAFGNMPGSEGGEFIFELHPETEFLSEVSTQLDQEAIGINAELDRVRKEIAAKTARNEQLRVQLAAAKTQLAAAPKGTEIAETAASHLNKGDSLFRERRYKEALAEFQAAAKLDPNSAVAANNVGFAYFRLGDFDEAISWTKRATLIDPNRAVAYVNLADLYYQLNRGDDARANYEKFLQLAPNSSYAPTARARLGKP